MPGSALLFRCHSQFLFGLLQATGARSFPSRNETIKNLSSAVRRFRDNHKGRMQKRLSACSSGALESVGSGAGSDSEFDPMCGRYRRTTSEEELARRYHIPIPPQRDLPISWNIAPTQDVLAVRFNPETKQRTLDSLRWGLIPSWAKDPKIAYKTINARVESVDTAPSYRQAFKKRRCLIPSDGFYE